MTPQDIGARLKEARQARGWSQATLAARAELKGGQAHLSRLEAGDWTPRVWTLVQLAGALGVTTDWLTGMVQHGGPAQDRSPTPS